MLVLVLVKPPQPSLIVVGKVRSLPLNGAPERNTNQVDSDLSQKH
jgi:hypothetical protein